MSEPPETLDYYTLFGIIRAATPDQIRSAFHRFAREHHPDSLVDASDEERDQHTALYQLGSEAYQVLLDPMKRKIYDEGLAKGRVRYVADRSEETRRTARPPGGVALNSSKARVFFSRAYKAMKAEDWPQAKLNLKMALQSEPNNEDLRGKLEEVLERMKSG